MLAILSPVTIDANDCDLVWREPDDEGLRAFLVDKMGFSVDRVNSGITKLREAQKKSSQKRMDR